MMDTDDRLDTVISNAGKLAGRYARRCPWMTYNDIFNEAVRAGLEACTTYKDDHGTPFGAYTYLAARYAIMRAVLSTGAPVSCRRDPRRLVGLKADSIYRSVSPSDMPGDAILEESASVGAANAYGVEYTHRESLAFAVRTRLVDLFGVEGAEFALLVISREFMPAETADQHEIDRAAVYRLIARMRARIADDPVLLDLWRNE